MGAMRPVLGKWRGNFWTLGVLGMRGVLSNGGSIGPVDGSFGQVDGSIGPVEVSIEQWLKYWGQCEDIIGQWRSIGGKVR